MKDWGKTVIILAGISGSGKTETGALLADELGIPFSDLDKIVADTAGMSIDEIFTLKGEAHFRNLESEKLGELVTGEEGRVISLGGGTLESDGIWDIIRIETVTMIWLRVSPAEAARRLEAGGIVDDRPLLKSLREDKLAAKLDELLNRRQHGYSRADIFIETDGLNPVEVVSLICKKI